MSLFRPIFNRLRRATGKTPEFWKKAAEIWYPCPAETHTVSAAIFLPGQLERIQSTIFADMAETLDALTNSGECEIGPTIAGQFRDVDLVDGVLYKGTAEYHLRQRTQRIPRTPRLPNAMSGAIYDSWVGLRYFGNWLMDDTETYRLADAVAKPLTLRAESKGHVAAYEALLGIEPQRVIGNVHFDEVILFRDLANNSGKKARAADRRARLAAGRDTSPKPGVFLLRGSSGDLRLLENERELADELYRRHGIVPMQPIDHSVEEILDACAGARLVIGVEGSHLTHALTVMPPGGTLLTIMPPDRVTTALKLMTDRLGLFFAFVVGQGTIDGFRVEPDEIEATIQLLP